MFDNNQNGTESQGFESQNNGFYGDSGVENVTKKAGKGKKAAIISGVTAAVVVGGGATAYACSDFVKNQVKLRTMKAENYYAWVCEENAETFAKSVSESYKKGLEDYGKGSSASVYVGYDVSDDVKELFLTEVLGEDYKSETDDESQVLIDVVNNIESLKVGADIQQKKLLGSYNAYAQLNGDNILSIEAVQDMENFDFFLRIPELTEKWLGAELGESLNDEISDELGFYGSNTDYVELYKDILENPEKFLSPEDIETEVKRYVNVWNETVSDVELEKSEEIDICDISVKYTVAEVEINEKLADKLAVNMLKELKNDEIVKKIVTDKLEVMDKSEYKDSIQELIDDLKDEMDDKDYDNDDEITLRTYIDSMGVIRGFEVEAEDEFTVFAAVGKDGDEVRGEVYAKQGKEKSFSAELTATVSDKKFDGQIDIDIPHTEYDDDWNPETTFETYTLSFKDYEVVNEDKGYFNADVSIIIPDIDPIDLEFKSSGKEQEIAYAVKFDGKDYGKVTLGFSSEESAKVEKPDSSNAVMIDLENADDFDITTYVTEDDIKNWALDVCKKLGFSDDMLDELADAFTEGFMDEINGSGSGYDWDDDDDYDWDDDDWDWDDDDDDDDDDYSYSYDTYDGVKAADDEAYIRIDDKGYLYYMGYEDDALAGNAKNAKITGDGEYTVSVTTESELFKNRYADEKTDGIYLLEIRANSVEGIGDAEVTVKSIKIDGKDVEIKQQPVSNYSYGNYFDIELYYDGYEEDAVFDAASVGEWKTIEVTFEVKGLK